MYNFCAQAFLQITNTTGHKCIEVKQMFFFLICVANDLFSENWFI